MKGKKLFIPLFLFVLLSHSSFAQTPPTPSITVIDNTISCSNWGIELASSASSGNVWSNGAITQSITVFNSGSYSVTQVVGNFTSAPSAPVTITICPNIHPTITPVGPFCKNSAPVTLQYNPSGNASLFGQGMMPGGANGPLFTPSVAAIGYNIIMLHLDQSCPGTSFYCSDTAYISIFVGDCDYIPEEFKDKGFSISSNPLLSEFTIKTFEALKTTRVRDLKGREVYYASILNEAPFVFRLENVPAGIYLLELEFAERKMYSKLLKEE